MNTKTIHAAAAIVASIVSLALIAFGGKFAAAGLAILFLGFGYAAIYFDREATKAMQREEMAQYLDRVCKTHGQRR